MGKERRRAEGGACDIADTLEDGDDTEGDGGDTEAGNEG